MSIRARGSERASDAREKGACCRNRRERSQSRRLGGAVNTGPLSFVLETDGALSEGANRAACTSGAVAGRELLLLRKTGLRTTRPA